MTTQRPDNLGQGKLFDVYLDRFDQHGVKLKFNLPHSTLWSIAMVYFKGSSKETPEIMQKPIQEIVSYDESSYDESDINNFSKQILSTKEDLKERLSSTPSLLERVLGSSSDYKDKEVMRAALEALSSAQNRFQFEESALKHIKDIREKHKIDCIKVGFGFTSLGVLLTLAYFTISNH